MTADIKRDSILPPDISKYQAILSKDPNSMVFAPLAEAYRKAGMLDEAIKTSQEGLKLHPDYLSGMVALGRACYEKGMLKEAGEALGQVVKIAPDNIIASKILEEIRKQWPVVSGQGPENLEPETGNLEPEEEPETLELEDIAEVEEVETEPVFGEEITEELWTGEAIPEKRAEPKRGITTETIADLYIKQGYLDKAIDIYQTIYDADPYNEEIKRKLDDLKKKVDVNVEEQELGVGAYGHTPSEESGVPLTPTPSTSSGQALSPEGRGEKVEGAAEDENVKRLEAWLKSIQNERRKG